MDPPHFAITDKMEETMKNSCIAIRDFADRIGDLGDALAVPEHLYGSSIIRPDPRLIRHYERIFRRIQELISHECLGCPEHKIVLNLMLSRLKVKNFKRLVRALRAIRLRRVGKLMEYYERGVPVAQMIVQVLATVSMKYKRLIESWQYTHNGYVCVTGPLPFLEYLAH